MMKPEAIIKHYPVMAANVMDKLMGQYPRALPIKLADCNFGFGGHSRSILKSFTNAQMYLPSKIVKPMIWIPKLSSTLQITMRMILASLNGRG